ncbi:MAG TPA: choice-of-anchor V domain-containing protein [Gemmatimonadota bacterium]|nr:choice-of-anchor V domain-containing protein [Gemmatimonadota bacterium]
MALTGAGLAAGAYVDGPPPRHTGGFGEPTCAACHFPGSAEPAARLEIRGAPEAWVPGETYRLTVAVRAPELGRGGFQLSARWGGGPCARRQAGTLTAVDGRAVARADSVSGVVYASHTKAGTEPTGPGRAEWTLEWTAPAAPGGRVVLHAAGNAANGDDSELGDQIALAEVEMAGPAAGRAYAVAGARNCSAKASGPTAAPVERRASSS